MGSLTIKNKALRCEKCFMLKKIIIEPSYPKSTIYYQCFCGGYRIELVTFVNELLKEEAYKITCSFCLKEPKHPLYCTGCRKIYCNTCKQKHDTSKETRFPHNMIDPYKYDFYCSKHQDQLVNTYCMNCSLNICQNCEKFHKSHNKVKYQDIILNGREKDFLDINLKVFMDKIDVNSNKCKEFSELQTDKKIHSELNNVCLVTVRDNRNIMNLINYFYKLYTDLKNKNYEVIFNLKANINFNTKMYPPNDGSTVRQKTLKLIEYYKTEFVLTKREYYTNEGNETKSNKEQKTVNDKQSGGRNTIINIGPNINVNMNLVEKQKTLKIQDDVKDDNDDKKIDTIENKNEKEVNLEQKPPENNKDNDIKTEIKNKADEKVNSNNTLGEQSEIERKKEEKIEVDEKKKEEKKDEKNPIENKKETVNDENNKEKKEKIDINNSKKENHW